jgi:hypothetical protein
VGAQQIEEEGSVLSELGDSSFSYKGRAQQGTHSIQASGVPKRSMVFWLLLFGWLVLLGFELRILCLLGRFSIA